MIKFNPKILSSNHDSAEHNDIWDKVFRSGRSKFCGKIYLDTLEYFFSFNIVLIR